MKSYLSTSTILALALFTLLALYWSQSTVVDIGKDSLPADFEFPNIVNPDAPFVDLRHRYLTLISEGSEYSVPHPPIRKRAWQDRVDHIHAHAEYQYHMLNKSQERQWLWVDIGNYTSSNITATFYRLGGLAQAWATPAGPLYHDEAFLADILQAVQWLVEKEYNPRNKRFGNWWDWQIGIPYQINDLVALFYDVMDPELRRTMLAASRHFIPMPIKTGANRVWTCKIITVRGILDSNKTEVDIGSQQLAVADTGVLDYVEHGDGFYRDGSFIQHDIHPYHGGYGKNLFKGLADIIYLLHGSAWELKDKRVNHIYEWAVKSFMPIVWRGALFANLRGREISRQDGTDYHAADDVITAMIRLIHISNDPQLVSTLKSWVKYNVVNARPWHDYLDTATGSLYRAATDIINDPLVNEQGDLNEAVWMRNADRGFLLRPGYAFTLGMSSNRIAAYECLNGGNLKGWYTGAGMTLVYNNDLGQYNDGYWATADMYHVPGTTASTNERTPCSGSRSVSREGWTTGSNTGVHASIGMRYRSWGGITNATKSWFFLDNEIVCLGAGITSHGITHTTIDQRQFLTQRHISLDNMNMTQESTFEKTIDAKSVYTIRLESNVDEASDLAYYVHEVTDPIIVSKRDLTGSWIDVNNGHVIQDNTPFQRKYASIVIDHGNSPVNASYVYSIRPKPELIPPGASFQVLANSEDVQAVQSADKRVIGAVFYAGGEVSGIFAADSSCAITVTLVTQGTVRVAVELPDVNAAADIRLMNLANYTLPNPVVGARITALGSGGLGLIVTNPVVTFDLISA